MHEFLPADKHIMGPPRMFRKEASSKQIKVSFIVAMLLLLLLLACSHPY
jgi:hypothetical protein